MVRRESYVAVCVVRRKRVKKERHCSTGSRCARRVLELFVSKSLLEVCVCPRSVLSLPMTNSSIRPPSLVYKTRPIISSTKLREPAAMAIRTPGQANLPGEVLHQVENKRPILAAGVVAGVEAHRPELGQSEIGRSTGMARTGAGAADVRRDHFSIRVSRMVGGDFVAATVTVVAVAEMAVAGRIVATASRIVISTTPQERRSSALPKVCWNCTPRGTAFCATQRTIMQQLRPTRSYLAR